MATESGKRFRILLALLEDLWMYPLEIIYIYIYSLRIVMKQRPFKFDFMSKEETLEIIFFNGLLQLVLIWLLIKKKTTPFYGKEYFKWLFDKF